jgi:hypothetical protein
VGAAQRYDIRSGIKKRSETAFYDFFGMRAGQFSPLDKINETVSGMFLYAYSTFILSLGDKILGAFQGSRRSQHSDDSGLCTESGRLDAGSMPMNLTG